MDKQPNQPNPTQQSKQLKQPKSAKVFSSRAQEELYYSGKQLYRTVFIAVVLSILIYLGKFFSPGLVIFFSLVGFIFILATLTYSIGHFVRFIVFKRRGE